MIEQAALDLDVPARPEQDEGGQRRWGLSVVDGTFVLLDGESA